MFTHFLHKNEVFANKLSDKTIFLNILLIMAVSKWLVKVLQSLHMTACKKNNRQIPDLLRYNIIVEQDSDWAVSVMCQQILYWLHVYGSD